MKFIDKTRELAELMIEAFHFDDDPKESLVSISIVAVLATYLVAAGVYLLITMIKASVLLWILDIIIGTVAVVTFGYAIVIYIAMLAILLNEIKSNRID